ncbi:N4-gp56 family major capsid protein [Nonomuraea sp. B19D2]|uniref:N4-gp56 family major capsid protein n=1 Tax=Nonomuraea sp. B19D2 TaxID=3159561 RepID=UPI0032DA9BC0
MPIFDGVGERDARFIPEVWTSRIWVEMRAGLVVGSDLVVNRDYEGEIRNAGDSVRIPTVTDPTVEDYDPTVGFTGDPQDVLGDKRTFEIERAKAFRIKVDDIAKVQSLIGGQHMHEGTQRAGRKLAEAADSYVAGKLVAAATGNRLIDLDMAPAVAPDVYYGQFVDVKVALDQTNTPQDGRWAIISPALHGKLLRDDRFIDVSKFGSSEPISNGVVGKFLGFRIHLTNALPTDVHLIAGHRIATTFADQLVKTETYRPEKFFADVVRGLHVYGAKVMRPEHIAVGKVIP